MESKEMTYIQSESHRKDVERAVGILKEELCSEVYVFGSVATGDIHEESDIDFGIRGYPKEKFFHIYGRLLSELEHGIDLIDFDTQAEFFSLLSRTGELKRVA